MVNNKCVKMKRSNLNCLIVLLLFASCVQKMYTNDMTPKKLPKEVPEMLLTDGVNLTTRRVGGDTSKLFNYSSPRFFISKHEITNKQFCQFLNEDSIRGNKELLKRMIDLTQKESKIYLSGNNLYAPIKGYAHYPVVLVSWWGAKKYCEWLSVFVNNTRAENELHQLPTYRLPSEYEWVSATTNKFELTYFVGRLCDSLTMYSDSSSIVARKVSKDTLNVYGVAGMNENVYEWTDSDFDAVETIFDYSMLSNYTEGFTADVVVRKHGRFGMGETGDCGRVSRLRTGYYADTGFRIIQSFLGRATGIEF
jgi:formylglycine-generating enzyme